MLGFSIFSVCVCVCLHASPSIASTAARPSQAQCNQYTSAVLLPLSGLKPFRLLLFLLTAQFSVTVILWDTAAGARIINYMSCFTD